MVKLGNQLKSKLTRGRSNRQCKRECIEMQDWAGSKPGSQIATQAAM